MGIRAYLDGLRGEFNNEELTPRFMKMLFAITAGFLVVSGIISYIIVFVIL